MSRASLQLSTLSATLADYENRAAAVDAMLERAETSDGAIFAYQELVLLRADLNAALDNVRRTYLARYENLKLQETQQ